MSTALQAAVLMHLCGVSTAAGPNLNGWKKRHRGAAGSTSSPALLGLSAEPLCRSLPARPWVVVVPTNRQHAASTK